MKFSSSRKSDPAPSPFSSFGSDTNSGMWGSPVTPITPDSDSDMSSDFMPVEPASLGEVTPISAQGTTRNVLNSDVRVVGTLRFTDNLIVDGTVEGEITSDGELTVGENAIIQAGEKNKVAVRTKNAIIHGHVTGDVVVTDRVELANTAVLMGDITATRIAIQEGATFVGHCAVGAEAGAPVAAPASSPKRASAKRTPALEETPDLLA